MELVSVSNQLFSVTLAPIATCSLRDVIFEKVTCPPLPKNSSSLIGLFVHCILTLRKNGARTGHGNMVLQAVEVADWTQHWSIVSRPNYWSQHGRWKRGECRQVLLPRIYTWGMRSSSMALPGLSVRPSVCLSVWAKIFLIVSLINVCRFGGVENVILGHPGRPTALSTAISQLSHVELEAADSIAFGRNIKFHPSINDYLSFFKNVCLPLDSPQCVCHVLGLWSDHCRTRWPKLGRYSTLLSGMYRS